MNELLGCLLRCTNNYVFPGVTNVRLGENQIVAAAKISAALIHAGQILSLVIDVPRIDSTGNLNEILGNDTDGLPSL